MVSGECRDTYSIERVNLPCSVQIPSFPVFFFYFFIFLFIKFLKFSVFCLSGKIDNQIPCIPCAAASLLISLF